MLGDAGAEKKRQQVGTRTEQRNAEAVQLGTQKWKDVGNTRQEPQQQGFKDTGNFFPF